MNNLRPSGGAYPPAVPLSDIRFTRFPWLLFLLFCPFSPLFPQTAADLEALLQTPAVTCAQAARFVLGAAGYGENTGSVENAFQEALDKRWFPEGTAAGEPVRLDRLSFLMTRAFNINGGFMYALLPGPRYALRALTGRSLIPGAADPAMTVSGERFLHILGKVLASAGEE